MGSVEEKEQKSLNCGLILLCAFLIAEETGNYIERRRKFSTAIFLERNEFLKAILVVNSLRQRDLTMQFHCYELSSEALQLIAF